MKSNLTVVVKNPLTEEEKNKKIEAIIELLQNNFYS